MSFTDAASTWHSMPVQIGEGRKEKERVLDEAYDEYCRLQDAGQSVSASLFCDRYPTYRKSLRRLLDVHETLDESDVEGDSWPQCDDLFLGFVVHRELGVGAIARVYLASELALGRRLVALKVSHFGSDEAETLGKLTHPNVVPVHSMQTDDETGMTAVCMPYLGSSTLADVLELLFGEDNHPSQAEQILQATRERELLPQFLQAQRTEVPDKVLVRGDYVDGVVHLAQQLAQGLAYTHSHGVLHRDLKPSNVLVTPSGCPMLLDFNLSCDEELNVNRMGGTLPYMAPEQIRAVFADSAEPESPADVRSDIFSLGIILYEMLTGRLPFGEPPADTAPRKAAAAYLEAQGKPLLPIGQLNPAVDRQVAETVERCLGFDFEQRPQSADELAHELQQHFAPRQRWGRFLYRHRAAVAATLIVTWLALALGIWHLVTRPPYDVRQYRQGLRDYYATRYDEAIQHFDRATMANPDFDEANFGRGVALMRLGNYENAAGYLDIAAIELDSAITYECLGYAKLMSEEPLAAAFAYGEALKRAPQELHLYLCDAYCSIDTADAEITLNSAIQLDETSQAAYFLRAKARVRMIELVETKTEKDGTLTQIVDKLTSQILADLDRAIDLGPPEPSLLIYTCQRYARAAERRPDLQPRLRANLQRAVIAGCRLTDLESGEYLTSYSTESWYQNLVAKCAPSAPAAGDYPFVTPPDDQAINAILSWR